MVCWCLSSGLEVGLSPLAPYGAVLPALELGGRGEGNVE